ncbi:alpha/beta fold hydrolase [Pseudohongiella sp.]|uniref:AB hydrolase-1 domain-containing protein n=1 Tax=marine sediment metagenome TaxID=412755 RepID=A0A0F9WII5_9ZZZZ|nr:alpha/beta hydrolase [Pseudohongiella sp.]HDZ07470.1 alpha/beta hydrolase [Pseudohongiella sp.]HEA63025.1 alpha/beta hydrolase [Pseudohongiella sp.]
MNTVKRMAMQVGLAGCLLVAASTLQADVWDSARHGYVDNDGVRIHYATVGEGPLMVMIHGFPDFWYSWRHQMEGLQDQYQVVAIDQRGYNLSGQPEGDENYDMRLLTADVAAVIRAFGQDSAIVVGHDWGGMVAWNFAFAYPQMVDRLVVMNLPHPNGMIRELTINEEQRANSAYARRFQQGSPSDSDIFFGGPMMPQTMAGWVQDPVARQRYVEAFSQSDFDAMLAYYKRNFPRLPALSDTPPPLSPEVPQLDVPLLVIHGLDDTALHSDGLNNTWDWNDAGTTIVAVPDAGHFVQQDAADKVTDTLRWWLGAQR